MRGDVGERGEGDQGEDPGGGDDVEEVADERVRAAGAVGEGVRVEGVQRGEGEGEGPLQVPAEEKVLVARDGVSSELFPSQLSS